MLVRFFAAERKLRNQNAGLGFDQPQMLRQFEQLPCKPHGGCIDHATVHGGRPASFPVAVSLVVQHYPGYCRKRANLLAIYNLLNKLIKKSGQ